MVTANDDSPDSSGRRGAPSTASSIATSVVVAADARLRGVAFRLVERLVETLRARGVRILVAFSLVENFGFEHLARRLGMTPSHAPGDGGVVTWSLAITSAPAATNEATAA